MQTIMFMYYNTYIHTYIHTYESIGNLRGALVFFLLGVFHGSFRVEELHNVGFDAGKAIFVRIPRSHRRESRRVKRECETNGTDDVHHRQFQPIISKCMNVCMYEYMVNISVCMYEKMNKYM